jgi:hypothetical protein
VKVRILGRADVSCDVGKMPTGGRVWSITLTGASHEQLWFHTLILFANPSIPFPVRNDGACGVHTASASVSRRSEFTRDETQSQKDAHERG